MHFLLHVILHYEDQQYVYAVYGNLFTVRIETNPQTFGVAEGRAPGA
jgi:hypothetical protein